MSKRIALTMGMLASFWAAELAAQTVPAAADTTELRCVKPGDGKQRPRGPAASAPGVTVYVNCGAPTASASASGAASASGTASGAASATAGASGASGASGAGAASQPASAAGPEAAVSAARAAAALDPGDLRGLRLALLWTLGALALLLTLYGIGSLLGALEMRPLGWIGRAMRPFVERFIRTIEPGPSPAPPVRDVPADFTFRRHWGSFGGESTGWNLSGQLARLLAGLVMIAIGLWVLLQLLAVATESKAPAPAAAVAATPAQPAPKPASAARR